MPPDDSASHTISNTPMTHTMRPVPHRPSPRRAGFTLVELLVVCSVIVALFAIGYPIMTMARANAMKSGTVSLVEGVAAAIATYGTRSWSFDDGGTRRTVMLWDLNAATTDRYQGESGYGEIDGHPDHGETLPAAVKLSGYVGLLDMAQPAVRPESVNEKRQIVDAWGEPLLISYPDIEGLSGADLQAELLRFGTDGFQVWSKGPDKSPGTADDIRHGVQNDE